MNLTTMFLFGNILTLCSFSILGELHKYNKGTRVITIFTPFMSHDNNALPVTPKCSIFCYPFCTHID